MKLALYSRKALAKDAGVAPDGDGSHRIAVASAAGAFTDPDGFVWETTSRISRGLAMDAASSGHERPA